MQVETRRQSSEAALQQDLAWLVQLRDAPIFYAGLVVENTTRCNARCAMCYQSAGPKGSDTWGSRSLTVAEIKQLLRDAIGIETLFPRFHLSGGEAFLDLDACLELFEEARNVGFLDVTTTTNAYWARRPDKADVIAKRLRAAGLTSMEISWDYWHSPFVPPDAVSNCLEACARVDIETHLRLLATRSHSYTEALDFLRPDAIACASRISGGPVFATGRAKRTIDPADFYQQTDISGNCHSVLNLTVNAKGDVFPCCAGLDQTDGMVFGNIRSSSIVEAAEALNRNVIVRTIVFGGVARLLPILESEGVDIGRDYNGICHLCWSIFSDPKCVAALNRYMDAATRRALTEVIARLESPRPQGSEVEA